MTTINERDLLEVCDILHSIASTMDSRIPQDFEIGAGRERFVDDLTKLVSRVESQARRLIEAERYEKALQFITGLVTSFAGTRLMDGTGLGDTLLLLQLVIRQLHGEQIVPPDPRALSR